MKRFAVVTLSLVAFCAVDLAVPALAAPLQSGVTIATDHSAYTLVKGGKKARGHKGGHHKTSHKKG